MPENGVLVGKFLENEGIAFWTSIMYHKNILI